MSKGELLRTIGKLIKTIEGLHKLLDNKQSLILQQDGEITRLKKASGEDTRLLIEQNGELLNDLADSGGGV